MLIVQSAVSMIPSAIRRANVISNRQVLWSRICDHVTNWLWSWLIRPCWASASAWALSYSTVKLFSKNSNLF